MKFKIGDVVKVINNEAFYYNAIGEVGEIEDDEIHVYFIAIDETTGEEFIYEDCYYLEEELEIVIKKEDL